MIELTEIVEVVNITVNEITETVNITLTEETNIVNLEVAEMGLQGLKGDTGAPLILQDLPYLP